MTTTLRCNNCDSIHPLYCPKCKSKDQRVIGSLDLKLLNINVEVSTTIGSMGRSLLIQKPSGQVIIPLADVDLHTQLKLKL